MAARALLGETRGPFCHKLHNSVHDNQTIVSSLLEIDAA
jgi:hypothetical protein